MGPSLSLGGRGDVSTLRPSLYSHTHTHTHTHSRTRARVHVRVTRARTLAVGQSRALEEWCPCPARPRRGDTSSHTRTRTCTHASAKRAAGQSPALEGLALSTISTAKQRILIQVLRSRGGDAHGGHAGRGNSACKQILNSNYPCTFAF